MIDSKGGTNMKKILIQESNNQLIDRRAKSMILPEVHEFDELRAFVLESADFSGLTDFVLFLEVMKWVNTCWDHDGINGAENTSSLEILKRAFEGENFRCVEYAKVTNDILLSMGYIARSLTIYSEHADYSGFGQAHSVTEVWSNRFKKWVFLDPQINVYAVKNDIPLSYYEVYASFDEVSFIFLSKEPQGNENDYREFISNYFGYLSIKSVLNDMKTDIFLHLNGKRQLMAFQAMQLSNALFTEKVEDIYFNPNNTAILFDYKNSVDPNKIIKENNLETAEEMKDSFDLFFVKPNFALRFHTYTPHFDHYELVMNEKEVKITNHTYDWSLKEGSNKISVCSVNKQGIKGSLTEMKIDYG